MITNTSTNLINKYKDEIDQFIIKKCLINKIPSEDEIENICLNIDILYKNNELLKDIDISKVVFGSHNINDPEILETYSSNDYYILSFKYIYCLLRFFEDYMNNKNLIQLLVGSTYFDIVMNFCKNINNLFIQSILLYEEILISHIKIAISTNKHFNNYIFLYNELFITGPCGNNTKCLVDGYI